MREGDAIFIFASENEGGSGLIANGVVTSADAILKRAGSGCTLAGIYEDGGL